MRPSCDAAPGLCGQLVLGHLDTEFVESFDDADVASCPSALQAGQAVLQRSRSRFEEQHNQVQRAGRPFTRDLDAGYQAQADCFGGDPRLGNAVERVVVGQRQRRETDGVCLLDQFGRRVGPVRVAAVGVQIDGHVRPAG